MPFHNQFIVEILIQYIYEHHQKMLLPYPFSAHKISPSTGLLPDYSLRRKTCSVNLTREMLMHPNQQGMQRHTEYER
jgi:hypothetical protein